MPSITPRESGRSGASIAWVRDRANDRWRILAAAGAVVSLVPTGKLAARGDWLDASFFALCAVELVSVVCAGVFVGESWLGWPVYAWVRRIALTDVQAVEVAPPDRRRVGVFLWVDDRRIAVGELGNRMSPARARDFAIRLTAGLQARGADAGMYDATTDEWPLPPRSADPEGE